jgi:hypothetical protein
MNEKLPFVPGKVYHRRNDIHKIYGGNWQSGICPSSQYPYIFIFSGKSGKQHGYRDGWANADIFEYTGEGQVGDMEFTKGNLALRDQLVNGKRVFLFESVEKGFVKFQCELEIFDFDFFDTHDRIGNERVGIKFFFNRKGANLRIKQSDLQLFEDESEPGFYQIAIPDSTEKESLVKTRIRQGAFRKSVIHRWNYECAVTQFTDTRILIASHIVPWKSATDEQRLDVDNGILLSPTYDALFDKHLISFDERGQIILGNQISESNYNKIGITGKEQIFKLTNGNQNYLEDHRRKFYES